MAPHPSPSARVACLALTLLSGGARCARRAPGARTTPDARPGAAGTAPAMAPMVPPDAPPPGARCLPMVITECGCAGGCVVGTPADGGAFRVVRESWPGVPSVELRGRVQPWCVAGQCTDALAVELPCTVVCTPRPADPTCHFEAGRCVGRR